VTTSIRALDQQILDMACAEVGLTAANAEVIRLGENGIYRLAERVVARIARTGQDSAAAKEVHVARWLEAAGVPAVQAINVPQPVVVAERAVTFWHELPAHHHGAPRDVAVALRRLHDLEPPTTFELPPFAPFVRLAERIQGASTLADDDRAWLRQRLDHLQRRYDEMPGGIPHRVIHGDAWAGNVVVTAADVVLLDLERCSVGPPEWDLVSTAIRYATFGTITATEYAEFVSGYGHDVMAWPGFELFRDMRELRVTCYAAQRATEQPEARHEAARRVASLRGLHGPRPWTHWRALS